MNYKIYLLLFPGGEVYVGKTSQTLPGRWSNGYKEGTKVKAAIDKYGWENVEKITLYTHLSKEEANRIEKEEIAKHGGIGHPLVLNIQSGGDEGYTITEETKAKMSKSGKQRFIDHPEILEDFGNWNNKPVNQYDLNGNFIKRYDSMKIASEETGISYKIISNAVETGPAKTGAGYVWRLADLEKKNPIIEIPSNYIPKPCKVKQIDKDTGEVIQIFDSVTEAANSLGICRQNISKCIEGKYTHTGGFKWERC